jgi:serine/threonine protein kinase
MPASPPLKSFNFQTGQILNDKFEVLARLGGGWEGEVYLVRELRTGIERTAKFFLPHRNKRNLTANRYAKKLHKLRTCSILIQYIIQENMEFAGQNVTYLISEYVEGVTLSQFLRKRKPATLLPYEGIHLLHALAKGLEEVHYQREYHGDIHPDNIIIRRCGLSFDIKVIDLFYWKSFATGQSIKDDVVDLIKVFYDALGGTKNYANMPDYVKEICCGLKKKLIWQKFKNAGQLRLYIEMMNWS